MLVLLLLGGCFFLGYGPPFDASKVDSASVLPDGSCLVTFREVVYRPATGIRAFPDGGIPSYVTDERHILRVDPETGGQEVLLSRKNFEWQPGQGGFHLQQANDAVAIVLESGQHLGAYTHGKRHWRLDLDTGKLTELKLEGELGQYGRAVGQLHLLDDAGTLLFEAPSLTDSMDRELWVRHPDGRYERIGPVHDYYGFEEGVLHFWTLDRLYHEHHLASGVHRTTPNRTHPLVKAPDPRLHCRPSGASLEFGKKQGGSWTYVPLPFTRP